jgi:hypothetical protein
MLALPVPAADLTDSVQKEPKAPPSGPTVTVLPALSIRSTLPLSTRHLTTQTPLGLIGTGVGPRSITCISPGQVGDDVGGVVMLPASCTLPGAEADGVNEQSAKLCDGHGSFVVLTGDGVEGRSDEAKSATRIRPAAMDAPTRVAKGQVRGSSLYPGLGPFLSLSVPGVFFGSVTGGTFASVVVGGDEGG